MQATTEETGRRFTNLVIEVLDNGMGIDPEKHFLLFKPFSQVHSEMSRTAQGGTGLGLAITKSIVESMKGSVKCISEGAGKGAVFRMEIPFEVSDAPDVISRFPLLPSLPRLRRRRRFSHPAPPPPPPIGWRGRAWRPF